MTSTDQDDSVEGADLRDDLRFQALGPVRAFSSRGELRVGSPQQQAVLCALLFRPGTRVSMADLVDAVWGDDSPDGAVGTVRTYVWRLRRVLGGGPAFLLSQGDGYRLTARDRALDAHRAADEVEQAGRARAAGRLEEASVLVETVLGRWVGDPLAAVPGPFAERQRERLRELRLSTLEEKYDLDLLVRGRISGVADLSALVAEHPFRERLHGLLMRALHATGRRTEALEVYRRMRHRLVEEQGTEPGHELAAVHRQMFEQSPPPHRAVIADRLPADPARSGPPAPVPAELPRPPACFTGRVEEGEALLQALVGDPSPGPPVVLLTGMPGVGKTSLGLRVAHQARDAYPDGQVFVDLRGLEPVPVPATDALAAVLETLGVAAPSLPEGVERRSRLLRSVLGGRRLLIFLDDVRDPGQILPLIPGSPHCAVVMTSRSHLPDLDTSLRAVLAPLPPADAARLARTVAGTGRDDDLDRLVRHCGYLPLAVRIAAGRLATRPGWPAGALANRLADERTRIETLSAGPLSLSQVFSRSLTHLPGPAAGAFRRLARAVEAGTGLDLARAADVLGLGPGETERILDVLVDHSLLLSPAPGRYRYHPLLLLFARQLTAPPERLIVPATGSRSVPVAR